MRFTDFKNHIVYFYTAYTGNLVKICIAIVETFLSVYFSLPATILKRQVSDRLVLALLISSTIPFLSVSFSLPPDTPSWRRPTIRHTVLSNTTLYLAFLSTQMFSMSHQHFLPISFHTLSLAPCNQFFFKYHMHGQNAGGWLGGLVRMSLGGHSICTQRANKIKINLNYLNMH